MEKVKKSKKSPVNRVAKKEGENNEPVVPKKLLIPVLCQARMELTIEGDRPLMVNNKMGVAWRIAGIYSGGGKTQKPHLPELSDDEKYAAAFYTSSKSLHEAPHPEGRYGIPVSGIAKCFRKAIRTTGITDNTTIGLIGKSFFIMQDESGLCLLDHDGFVKDSRPVNIGSGQKTVPQIRHRPLFPHWSIVLKIAYNPVVLSHDQIGNLAQHAGQYIGLCELRAEKGQGECGGFVIG